MKFKYILGAAALISSMVAGAVHAATYNIELTEFGVGDAGADWFGTVELDGSFMLLSASIAAKGFFFDTVGVLSIGNNTLDPVSGTFSAWILEDTYSATDQAGLQFWGGTDFRWSFDTTCSTTSGCGGLPQLGTYTLALVPLPASLPMLLKWFAFDVNRKGIPKVLFV